MTSTGIPNDTMAIKNNASNDDDIDDVIPSSSEDTRLQQGVNLGNSSWDGKMVTILPSKPYYNFYHHYHSYMAVIFIAVVIGIILCSVIYVGLRTRKRRHKKSRGKDKLRRSFRRPLSRDSSQSTLSNYQSFSSRRSNNKHARLTSQRSWADSPRTGVPSPFYDEVLNKSLPPALEPGSVHMSPLSPHQYRHEFSSGAVSTDVNSSTGELTRFYRQQGAISPAYDIRSPSSSPESVSENKRHQIPLPELKSGRGIVVQISNMDLISTAVPRNPFPEKRKFKPLPLSSNSSRSSCDSLPPSISPLDTPSGEFKALGTISEEKQERLKSTSRSKLAAARNSKDKKWS